MPSKPLDTIVYIDGFNFYHSLKNTSYKWLNIEKLINSILDSSWHNVIKIKYFTAKTPFSESAHRQSVYFKAIDTLQKVEIVYGKFKKRHIKVRKKYIEKLFILTGEPQKLEHIKSILRENIVQFPTNEEKETDVNIATHIIYDCCKENISSIVLLSNDTDLKLPLWFARKKLKKRVVVITPMEMETHQDLRKISNKTLSLKENHLKKVGFRI
ncbi:MAG: NYN domain-containing protein [Bdellovibrionales bacterium]|nr:NYN domain-containing protein [Bdellovibrionales bacterium]